MNGAAGQNHVVEGLFKGSGREVHWADREERQSVDADHDDNENPVQNDLDQTNDEFSVQHENGLVLPRVLAV